jgi:ABC-type molybdate transport system substrate-binding protein
MRFPLLALALLLLPAHADKLAVAVDPSLREVAQTLAQLWADRHEDTNVELSVADVGTLKTELAKTTDWDVVVVPGQAQVQEWVKNKVLAADSLKYPARNPLVILGRNPLVTDEELSWTDLVEQEWRSFAAAAPATSGSGPLIESLLTKRHLWDGVKPLLQRVPTEKAALLAVQSQKVDAAFLYASQVREVKLAGYRIYHLEGEDACSVLYTAGVVSTSKQGVLAREFIDLLVSAAARPAWTGAGFDVGGPGVDIGLRQGSPAP